MSVLDFFYFLLFFGRLAAEHGVRNAGAQMLVHQLILEAAQRRDDRICLGEYVHAVPTIADHFTDAPYLTLDSLEASD